MPIPKFPRINQDFLTQLRTLFHSKDRSVILGGNDFLGVPLIDTPEINPLVDNHFLYFKSDKNLYKLDWDGNETQLNVNPIVAKSNIIINADLDIWQRGTSFAAIASGTYHADRFRYDKSGTMVHTISRSTDVPTVAQSGHKSNYSLKIDCTTADAAIAAGDFTMAMQRIEGYNFAPYVGKTAHLSFWVKATKTGIYCVSFSSSTADRSYVAEYTINAASTWERKDTTIPFDFIGGTWDYINGIGLQVRWALTSGSNFQTTANAWQNGNFLATANQVNACDNTANDFFLSQVQLRPDNPAIFVVDRLYDEEFAAAQRYYEVIGITSTSIWVSGYASAGGQSFGATLLYAAQKRAIPTLTKNGTWATINCGQPSALNPSISTFRLRSTSTAAGVCYFYIDSNDDTVTIACEL